MTIDAAMQHAQEWADLRRRPYYVTEHTDQGETTYVEICTVDYLRARLAVNALAGISDPAQAIEKARDALRSCVDALSRRVNDEERTASIEEARAALAGLEAKP